MKKYIFLLPFLLFITRIAMAQALPFKNDSLYNTIYARELCTFMQKHPDAVVLDVRTPGEFSDTSRFATLNHGHLKGAMNLNIEDIRKDSTLLEPYKNKTIVVYCSHSQRSRRLSKFMTDNGFQHFYNLNGGMSSLNQLTEKEFPCKKEWIVSSLPYKNLSFFETAELLRNNNNLLIIDVRPTSQYNSADTSLSENIGRIKGAISIPFDNFRDHLEELSKYKQKPILVYGQSGDGNPARAAMILTENGFSKVSHLLGGINGFVSSLEDRSCIENATPYRLLNAERSLKLLKSSKDLIIYDTRPDEEFSNQVKGATAYRNLGHMKNAVHMQTLRLQILPADKSKAILVYGNNQEAFRIARQLTDQGYKQVSLLSSFYEFVWSGFNVETCKEARTFLVDHEGLY